jgi:hypothetical protein
LAIAATLLPFSAGVMAEPLTLDYQLVVHVTETHGFEVFDEPGHTVGIAAFRGLAIFADGRVARHDYAGHFDFVDDAGGFEGYARWVFADGSQLRSRYVGTATARPDGGIDFTGSHGDITGTGIYAGATGSGTFAGERIDYLRDGGEVYQRGRLELELPEVGDSSEQDME